MPVVISNTRASGKFITVNQRDIVVAHAYVFFLKNSTGRTFAFVEDVFVNKTYRGKGHARTLYEAIAAMARKRDCYKIIACSRKGHEDVHAMMAKLGYTKHGYEFRLEL